ncbi:hypothetical protein ALC62_13494 [Cyphomyrmex costatus]|uniref:DNA-directed DNA polymerase n=1 Tax=Cyphomyrmex costatus TaxID=456900 RepID=A0A151I9W3_9HYME|nr:hypothetical protein ALC62_13494 [Cyphomyrmex costatus]
MENLLFRATRIDTLETYLAWESNCDEYRDLLREMLLVMRDRQGQMLCTMVLVMRDPQGQMLCTMVLVMWDPQGQNYFYCCSPRVLPQLSLAFQPSNELAEMQDYYCKATFAFRHSNDLRKCRAANSITLPLRVTKIKRNIHVNLLYVQDQQHDDNGVGHFVLIKDLSRLLNSQLSGNASKKYICDRCLHYFKTRDKLSSHDVDCARMNKCTVLLPNENDKWLSFRNYNRKKRLPFVVYADLECILEKTRIDDDHISRFNYQHHKVFSIGYYVCCVFDETMSMYASFRGENCVEWFIDELYKLTHRVKSLYVKNLRINQFTTQQWQEFVDATHYHICEKPFEIEHLRVRDHCHITGRYRGPAHSDCNINYRDSCVIPVFFHNLSGYDAYFIIKDIANKYEGTVHLLPVTKENYISFTKYVKDTVNGS